MGFDGAISKEGAGAGVWVHSHKARYLETHSYKLNFQCSNNIAEYEALMLGMKLLKKLGSKRIMVRGDSELIIKQIKGQYAAKPPRLKSYRNVVLDFLQCFIEIDLQVIPRGQNILAYGLATSTATCKIPYHPNHQFTVEVKCRPIVPNNIRYWQVFGNDEQIEDFLQSKNDFECTNIDVDSDDDSVNKLDLENDSVYKLDLENDSVNKVDSDEINEKG
jgi:hypothetical protein